MSPLELVNGYVCHNCTDVAYAQRNIDPQHPKDGPFGVNKAGSGHGPAVVLGGALAKTEPASQPRGDDGVAAVNGANPAAAAGPDRSLPQSPGRLDILA